MGWVEATVTRTVKAGLKDLLMQVGTEKMEGAPTSDSWICSGNSIPLI